MKICLKNTIKSKNLNRVGLFNFDSIKLNYLENRVRCKKKPILLGASAGYLSLNLTVL